MPDIRPIHAVRYATTTPDISSRIAPPYDVLDEGPKQDLLARDPHNIVAIDLPVTPPKTLGPDSAYDAAGETFRQWLAEGVLIRENEPALFAYEQVYTVKGREFKRQGLFANIRVEDFNQPNGIWRHEHTIKGGTDDRLKLMQATDAQLSPVFGIFRDPEQKLAETLAPFFQRLQPTLVGTTPHDQVVHRLWRITDRVTIDAVGLLLRDREVFIADGHHRYTTALNYSNAHPDTSAARNCLFVLVPAEDPGMIVLETHRIISGLTGYSTAKLIELCENDSDIVVNHAGYGLDGLQQVMRMLPKAGPHAMALHDPKGEVNYLLTFTPDPLVSKFADRAEVWRTLDVAVLHHHFIDGMLRPHFGGDQIVMKYEADLTAAHRIAHSKPDQLLIAMQPTPLQSVIDVSLANEVMPPKSTFFYPKLATGLIINPLT